MIDLLEYPARLSLASLPTRIMEPPRRLTDYLGDRRLLVKRDDETGCSTSGNKVRKLEYYAAEAVAEGADTLITGGNRLSNHARAAAVVARELGLDVHLMLSGNGSVEIDGNIFLDKLLGAEVHYVPSKARWHMMDYMMELADDLRTMGRRPYIIPAGGTGPLGVIAYVRCVEEIKHQLDSMGVTIDAVTCALGSGSTAAGLILGARLFDLGCPVYPVHISRNAEDHPPLLRRLIDEAVDRFHIEVTVPDSDIHVLTGYVGEGYGLTTPEELCFIHDIARRTGLIFDPVYTGKAFRGMLEHVRDGELSHCKTVLFIHTGGIYGLFSHRHEFEFARDAEQVVDPTA
jgi:D-cysteine desulfhydrase